MNITTNTFCWHGIATNMEAGLNFYPRVLGWDITGPADGPMFKAPGGEVAHIQPASDGPPAWCSFLSVDDVDASTAKAAEHGTVIVPPTDLPVGRFSVVATPTGAVFGLYQADASDALAAPGPGSIHWVELQSTAPETDLAWLTDVFGLTYTTQDMATGPYHVLQADGTPRGGVMASQSGRSVFMPWVHVADLDDTIGKVGEHGGGVVMKGMADPEVGSMAVVRDPSGAVFGLVQPNA